MTHARSARRSRFHLDFPLIFAIAMVVLLWVAGGASRANEMGQVVVRAGCCAILIATVLCGPRPSLEGTRPVFFLLIATIALPLVQLIPLPPAWWQALPGREILLIPGEPLGWRPWTMTPGATFNALVSLVVPATMLLVLAQGKARLRAQLPTILLTMIVAAVLLGLLQFTGAGFNNPLLNDTPGQVSGTFANRNHFSLFIAIGCLIAPVWAFMDRDAWRWRGPLAAGLVVLFVLTILATGSRAGMLLGGLSLILALALVGRRLRHRLGHAPSWVFPALILASVVVISSFIALSFAVDRADAINRLITLEAGEDMRSRALPTVLAIIDTYMPFGSGFGGFDPSFRMHEPFQLLKYTYFNQAHNDFLGIALDGGIAAIIVLAAALLWWLISTIHVWRADSNDDIIRGRLGSAIIALVMIASLTDYPTRTPTVMAIIIIAAFWLAPVSSPRLLATLHE